LYFRIFDASFANKPLFPLQISSTTIGLGDIFLEPEVLILRDLIVFPVIFLFGFVTASAFLSQFGEFLQSLFGKKSLVDDLLNRLKSSDMASLERVGEVVETGTTAIATTVGTRTTAIATTANRASVYVGAAAKDAVGKATDAVLHHQEEEHA
jgi:hypothetical protein